MGQGPTPHAEAVSDMYRFAKKIQQAIEWTPVSSVEWLFCGLRLSWLRYCLEEAKVREEMYRVSPDEVNRFMKRY